MRNPVLAIRLPIELRTLDIDILIPSIEVHILHRRRLARQAVLDANLREIRRQDEIDVLSAHGPQAHHGEGAKGAHGAGVVVSRDAVDLCVELGGNVVVAKVRGQAGAAGVVEEEDEEEGLLIAKVEQVGGRVEELEALDEGVGPAEGGDEVGHVVGGEEGVEPAAALVRLFQRRHSG